MGEKLERYYQLYYTSTKFYSPPMTKSALFATMEALLMTVTYSEQISFTILPVELTHEQYIDNDENFIYNNRDN